MEIIVYAARCMIMFLVVWLGIRLVGKKSIAQITSYDLAGILLLSTLAAEPIAFKSPSKATEGVLVIAFMLILIGKLSLSKTFYNADNKPSVVVVNGKIDKKELRKNKMNVPFLLSQLRLKNITKIADVEFAIVEADGRVSVIPKSQERAAKPKDLKIDTQYEGLALPIILDGEIQYSNLKYANLDTDWLDKELKKAGDQKVKDILLAELNSQGQLYLSSINDIESTKSNVPPLF